MEVIEFLPTFASAKMPSGIDTRESSDAPASTFITSEAASPSSPHFVTMSKNSPFISRVVGLQSNLFSFAYKLTSDHDRASDLVQDTTLKALDSEDKFAENVNFKGWLFTIMRNIFINNYRRQMRENTVTDTTDNLFHLNATHPEAYENPDGSYAVGEINEIISRLPDDFKKPFQMYIAGYKYDEIAQKLSLPMGTVKSRIFTTRRQLRAQLQDYR